MHETRRSRLKPLFRILIGLLLLVLLAFGSAVTIALDAQVRPMRPVPISAPGSTSARVALTELQALKLDNISLRLENLTAPLRMEWGSVIREICAGANLEPGCSVDVKSHTVTGMPLTQRAQPPEPQPTSKAKTKKKHEESQ